MSDELLEYIRQKILDGTLPKQNCRMTWYGPGTGGVCVACERAIDPKEVEVECDLPAAARSGSIARATTSGRRSGRAARAHNVRASSSALPAK